MRYVESRCVEHDREEAYRIYVTDALKLMGKLNLRYFDMVSPGVEETRTSEEIVDSISAKLKKAGGE